MKFWAFLLIGTILFAKFLSITVGLGEWDAIKASFALILAVLSILIALEG